MIISRNEFIERYCENSGIEWSELKKSKVVLPCGCDYEACQGWAMVMSDFQVIEHHKFFYGRDVEPIYNEESDSYSCPECGSPAEPHGFSTDGDGVTHPPQEDSWFSCVECGWIEG